MMRRNYFPLALAFSIALHMALLFAITLDHEEKDKEKIFKRLQVSFGQANGAGLSMMPLDNLSKAVSPELKPSFDKPAQPKPQPIKPSESIDDKGVPLPADIPNKVNAKEGFLPQAMSNDSSNQGVELGNATHDKGVVLTYEQLLPLWLERFKKYPATAEKGLTGRAIVFLSVNRQGQVVLYKIKQSTGHLVLDKALIRMIRDANPAIPFPDDYRPGEKVVSFEIEFIF